MSVADVLSGNAVDAGNKSDEHYRLKLSPLRYKLRAMLLPLVQQETPILYKIQTKLRCRPLDLYFSWTANLASHTFYVIMLPLPFWFGHVAITRDLVWVLGFGIFLSGCCKDYFCLPRPRSPPLHRITMSGYTAKEYGFPSSHSANATAVTLVVFSYYITNFYGSISLFNHLLVCAFVFIYYFSLIFGRIYCGMHGFLDIAVGSLIGVVCVIGRFMAAKVWDPILLNPEYEHQWLPLAILAVVIGCIHFHAQPVDDCPCFDDSVAFIGVLMGLELCHYFAAKFTYVNQVINHSIGIDTTVTAPFSFKELGIVKTLLRVLLGVMMIVVWKTVSKKVLLRVLPPIYSKIGWYIPRNYFKPVSQSNETFNQIYQSSLKRLDNDEIADVPKFVKNITQPPEVVDKQGPDSMADVYELMSAAAENDGYITTQSKNRLAGKNGNNNGSSKNNTNDYNPDDNTGDIDIDVSITNSEKDTTKRIVSCVALRPRYDVEIVARLIIYGGIAGLATLGFGFMVKIVGLDYDSHNYAEA